MTDNEAIVHWLYGAADYWHRCKYELGNFYPGYEEDIENLFYLICLLTEEE
jgi:hypothetical protein